MQQCAVVVSTCCPALVGLVSLVSLVSLVYSLASELQGVSVVLGPNQTFSLDGLLGPPSKVEEGQTFAFASTCQAHA
jgi:hypothetical protein